MPVIPLKADIHQRSLHVRLVPIADIWLFVRVYSQWAYGIPPEQVVGTAGGTKYSYDTDGNPILTKEPKLLLNDNDAFSESSMVATTSPTASSLVRYWTALTTASAVNGSPLENVTPGRGNSVRVMLHKESASQGRALPSWPAIRQ
jgi:hypothetical protein